MVVLKLQLDNDIRRITLNRIPSFQGLCDLVPTYFQKKTPQKFILKYLDDEKDLITLSSEEELKEAYRLAQKTGFLKVKVISSKEPMDYVDDVTAASQRLLTNISTEVKSVATKVQERVAPPTTSATPTAPVPPDVEQSLPADANFFHDVAQALENAIETIAAEVRTMVGNFKEKLSQHTQTERADASEHTQTDAEEMPNQASQTEDTSSIEEEEDFVQVEEPAVQSPVVLQVSEMDAKLNQLEEMGFVDRPRNIQLLVKNKGSVIETVKDLLE